MGFTIGPGTAKLAVELGQDLIMSGKEVAIIGSGVIGLMVADHILEENPKTRVTIYSDIIPSFCNKNNADLIVS